MPHIAGHAVGVPRISSAATPAAAVAPPSADGIKPGEGPKPAAMAPVAPPAGEPAVAAPGGFTDAQGRPFTQRIDPQNGHILLEHASQATRPDGNRLTLNIVIDIDPATGAAVKTVNQRLDNPNGDVDTQKTVTSYDPQGTITGEVTDATTRQGARTITEHTVNTYAGGQVVRRDSLIKRDETETQGADTAESKLVVKAVWDAQGQPVTDQTVPVLDRTEHVKLTSKGAGINKDTDRIITQEVRAVGPLGALTYPDPMKVTVRFNGRDGQYIERKLEFPLDAQGDTIPGEQKEVAFTDNQKTHVKVIQNARIWGGFASNIGTIAGANLLRVNYGLGRALIIGSFGASLAETGGEGYAIADKRNDASWARMAMSVYDTTWQGLYTLYARRRSSAQNMGPLAGINLLPTAAGAAGAVAHTPQLGKDLANLGTGQLRDTEDPLAALDRAKGILASAGDRSHLPAAGARG